MLISDLIKKLQEAQAEHGDLEVQAAVPEGPYTRLVGDPDVFGLGYMGEDCDYLDEENYEDIKAEIEENAADDGVEPDFSELSGPYFCIGTLAIPDY
jgi:hypothetical protein